MKANTSPTLNSLIEDLRRTLRHLERLANAKDARPLAERVLTQLTVVGPHSATSLRKVLRCDRAAMYAALRSLERQGAVRRAGTNQWNIKWESVSRVGDPPVAQVSTLEE